MLVSLLVVCPSSQKIRIIKSLRRIRTTKRNKEKSLMVDRIDGVGAETKAWTLKVFQHMYGPYGTCLGRTCLDEPYTGPALRALVIKPCNLTAFAHFCHNSYMYDHASKEARRLHYINIDINMTTPMTSLLKEQIKDITLRTIQQVIKLNTKIKEYTRSKQKTPTIRRKPKATKDCEER